MACNQKSIAYSAWSQANSRRWNAALKTQTDLEQELEELRKARSHVISEQQQRTILALGADLQRLWEHPQSQPEFKKRIIRTLLMEVVVTAEGAGVRLLLHWRGGDHTQLYFEKVGAGHNRFITDRNTVELIRGLARLQPDGMIASILNRNADRTPHGERWTARSICSLRNRHAINVYVSGEWHSRSEMTVEEAAKMLNVTETAILKRIRSGRLPATQICPNAPWVLRQSDVESFKAPSTQNPSTYPENTAQLALKLH